MKNLLLILFSSTIFFSCINEDEKIEQSIYGIGPIKQLKLEPINDSIMQFGIKTFNTKCSSCHTMEYKNSGPDLSDLLARRQPEWVLNYLLNQQEMLKMDSIAIKTNNKYETNCKLDSINEVEAYGILEYFRMYQIWLHEFNAK